MQGKSPEADEQLIRRYQAGEQSAADLLIERYKQLVRAHARTLFLAGGDRDDLLQEGMIGLFRAIRRYDPDREDRPPFHSYAAVCIDRQMYSAIMAAGRQKNRPLNNSISLDAFEPDSLESRVGTGRSPESLLLDEESVSQTTEEIRRLLSPYEARVLELYIGGMNYQEIAEILDRSPKSVDNALNRMKKKASVYLSGRNERN